MIRKYPKFGQNGFNLIEVLVVITIVGFLAILFSAIPNSLNLISKSNHLSTIREIINKQIEDKRSTPYANLANGEVQINDSRVNLLPSGSGKVTTEDCPISICSNGELAKKITITINWKEFGKPQQEITSTLVSEGGLTK